MNRLGFLLWLLASLIFGASGHAQLPQLGRNAIRVELVAENDRPAAGAAIALAIKMTPNKGWHGYWKNPGDAGAEMRVEWQLPAGVSVGPLRYPVPERLMIAGLMNYVFNGPYVVLTEINLPPHLRSGTQIPIRANLEYLACTDQICVPEKASVFTDLVVGSGDKSATRRAEFDRYRQALPKSLGTEASFEISGERLRIGIPFPAALKISEAYFYPHENDVLVHAATQEISRAGDRLIIETEAGDNAASAPRMTGLLSLGDGQGLELSALPGSVPASGTPLSTPLSKSSNGGMILAALLGALVGGLILNFMPCIFPIISLKALSLVKGGTSRASARRDALAYTAGAILVSVSLGALILLLRSGGEAVGWAFQLQDPRVILFLLLLITAIALNLAGLFELPALGLGNGLFASTGTAGAFWTGALAAFVATPCTGPFMGAALGAALVLPGVAAIAVFAGLGLGLALPFLLLGFIPALRGWLPKPGPWMATLRRILAVPMFLTGAGLAWILGRQSGADGMALGLFSALLLGLALWWVGIRQSRATPFLLPLAVMFVVGLASLLIVPTNSPPTATVLKDKLSSEPFSEARLAALLAERRPVFVYFTADWCLTCKVNEEVVLDRADIAAAFKKADVAILRGDWTRGDPAIGRFLEKHGRSGVPLYLWYQPGKEEQILPQILTVNMLLNLTS